MKIYPFKAQRPDFNLISSADSFFGTVKENYNEFVDTGFYTDENEMALYIYHINRNGIEHLGFLGSVDIEDYKNGKILKHENTIAAKEQSMMQMILKRQAMIKPVLLSYPKNDTLEALLRAYIKNKKPLFSTELIVSKQKHRIWSITDTDTINKIKTIFNRINKLYVADGHHRCSSMAFLSKNEDRNTSGNDYSQLFSAFFPFSDMEINSYNRVVHALRDLSTSRFIAGISKYCDITYIGKTTLPKSKYEMTMLLPFESYRLKWKKEILKNEKAKVLDTTLFNNYILDELLGIKDVRTDTRVQYIEGTKGWKGVYERVMKREQRVGFILHPVKLKDFKSIAHKGNALPPKSTWFEPRMLNGLVVQKL